MSRKQVGMIDAGLLGRVDAVRVGLGQTRRVFVERALEAALSDETPRPSPAGRQARTEAATTPARPATASPQGASRPAASPRTSVPAVGPSPASGGPDARYDKPRKMGPTKAELDMDRQKRLNAARQKGKR